MAKSSRGGEHGFRLGRTQKQDAAIKALVKRTQDLKKEQYRIINGNGDVVLEKKGDKHSVATTIGEKRDNLAGNISVHNHPAGGTFSPIDMTDFAYGAKEIVAASPEGTYRLVNNKYGTKDAFTGWRKLMEGAEAIPQASQLSLLQQARANLANSETQKEINKINGRFTSIRANDGSEAAKSYYESVKDRYDSLAAKHKDEVERETRRLETEPFHKYYAAHASEFGFTYRFEKKAKRR